MTTKPKVTDRPWLNGSERDWARFLRWAVLVAAALGVNAPSPAQEGLYDPVPGAVSEDHGATPAPDGLVPVTGADAPADPGTPDDPNADGEPPGPPSYPDPANGATGVPLGIGLNWSDSPRADSYDVYFGSEDPPPFLGNTSVSRWSTNRLDDDTTYYWQIVAKNAFGSTPGPVWSFHTVVICRGDLNCDSFIDFGDINPYVLALSNWAQWKATYPNCPEENADINGDGQYGGVHCFAEINLFANLLASGGGYPIPCQPPAGACHLAAGGCEVRTEADCTAADGVWQGAGTDCAPNADGEPPGPASYPDPPNGATAVPLNTNLHWWQAPRADSYDVYFGTDAPPPYVGNTSRSYPRTPLPLREGLGEG